MCDICKSENLDSRFINGDKYRLFNRIFYSFFSNRITPIKLCFLHDLELFALGERRFIKDYPNFVVTVLTNPKKFKGRGSAELQLRHMSRLI